MMTFEPEDVIKTVYITTRCINTPLIISTIAMDSLRLAQEIAERLRRGDPSDPSGKHRRSVSDSDKQSTSPTRWSFTGLLSGAAGLVTGKGKEGGYLRDLSRVQRHSELVGAEAQVNRAMLAMITQTNFMALIKEGLAIRTSYNTLRAMYKFLARVGQEEGPDGLARLGLDEEFISGVICINSTFSLSVYSPFFNPSAFSPPSTCFKAL
jgi:hypothetical protein